MTAPSGLTDVTTLRVQARAHIDQGAVTAGYSANRSEVIKLLNDALATELVCVALSTPPFHGPRHSCQEYRRRIPDPLQ